MAKKKYKYNLDYCIDYDYRDKETNTKYYVSQFLNRLQMMFKINGLPDTIKERDMLLLIMTRGYGVMIENEGKVYIVEGSLGGIPDQNYMPTEVIIANPYLRNLKTKYIIDKDCVVFNCDSTYQGVMPIITKYAVGLVENDLSMFISIINLRAMNIFTAKSEPVGNAVNKVIKDIEAGEIASIKSSLLDDNMVSSLPYAGSSAMSNILISLIENSQYLKGCCWMDLGVKAAYNMKREALGDAETDLQDASLLPYVDNMKRCLDVACEKANKMFGLNLSAEFDSAWEDIQNEEEHKDDEESDYIAPPEGKEDEL